MDSFEFVSSVNDKVAGRDNVDRALELYLAFDAVFSELTEDEQGALRELIASRPKQDPPHPDAPRNNKIYTPREDELIRERWLQSKDTVEEIGEAIGRSADAVTRRLYTLGLRGKKGGGE